jgi:eukaryotic-like serine/threonine-protein kinase
MTLGRGYALERLLGAGGQSRVYAARPPDGGVPVALKILSLSRVKDPKALELFRRSAEVLASLSHPGIARLLTYFEETRPHAALYCLVQELVPGESLAKAPRLDEAGVVAIARSVLPTLSYLHDLSPPVIHRDIKPSNLIRKPDGGIVLIDFDLVRDALRPEGGSTSRRTAGRSPSSASPRRRCRRSRRRRPRSRRSSHQRFRLSNSTWPGLVTGSHVPAVSWTAPDSGPS